jgi:hypothetical protein
MQMLLYQGGALATSTQLATQADLVALQATIETQISEAVAGAQGFPGTQILLGTVNHPQPARAGTATTSCGLTPTSSGMGHPAAEEGGSWGSGGAVRS